MHEAPIAESHDNVTRVPINGPWFLPGHIFGCTKWYLNPLEVFVFNVFDIIIIIFAIASIVLLFQYFFFNLLDSQLLKIHT